MELRITRTTETYARTASNKGWQSKPTTTETDVISERVYENLASEDSIRFWNGFCGGSCRAVREYTYKGYTPTQITRVSPDGAKKIVERFRFEVVQGEGD